MTRAAGIAALIDLGNRLERDREETLESLRRRDRRIGAGLEHLADRPVEQLGAWLAAVTPSDPPSPGRRYAAAHRFAVIGLSAAGLLLGWAAAMAVFYYDGSEPVNIIKVLAVFVGAQLLLLLLLGLTLLPPGLLRALPGAEAVREGLSLFSPGRLRGLALRKLPVEVRDAVANVAGRGRGHGALYGRVERWAVVFTAQAFAVWFNAGALLGCLYLITFSDLAFSWNTTLEVDPAGVHRLLAGLAAPWQAIAPEAVPSLELVEATRHYRLQSAAVSSEGASHPALFGAWWPFLLAAMTCYGLLPRLALWILAGVRFRAAADYALRHLPGVQAVLDRLNASLVETSAEQPEGGRPTAGTETAGGPIPAYQGPAAGYALVNWADVGPDESGLTAWAATTWGTPPVRLLHGGGARTLEDDTRTLEQAAALDPNIPIVLLVKAWEPPLAECIDFLKELRARLGETREIAVVPVERGPDGALKRAADGLAARWQRRLNRAGDPWLRVYTLEAA